jgi:hypothetical protein
VRAALRPIQAKALSIFLSFGRVFNLAGMALVPGETPLGKS